MWSSLLWDQVRIAFEADAMMATKALSDKSPEQISALVNSLQVLSLRMQDLIEARAQPQAQLLVQELLTDFRAWRLQAQASFHEFSRAAVGTEEEAVAARKRLGELMQQMEQRIENTLNEAPEGLLGSQDAENFYRLLGAYRGVSEATVAYLGAAGGIDWERWRLPPVARIYG